MELIQDMNNLLWPLPDIVPLLPEAHPGAFGTKRRYDIHTGIDLYCAPNTEVISIEPGEVIKIEEFTGINASSPWWNDTHAVWIYNKDEDRTIVYGELSPVFSNRGKYLPAGSYIGSVKTVLKKNKGLPMSMLHLEMYEGIPKEIVWWDLGSVQPDGLSNPTEFLKSVYEQYIRLKTT